MRCTFYIPRLRRTCLHSTTGGSKECYQHRKYKYPRTECPVCYNVLPKWEVPLNPCQHWVCMDCVIKSGKEECPLCKTKVKVPLKHMSMLRFYSKRLKRYVDNESLNLVVGGNVEIRDLLALIIRRITGIRGDLSDAGSDFANSDITGSDIEV